MQLKTLRIYDYTAPIINTMQVMLCKGSHEPMSLISADSLYKRKPHLKRVILASLHNLNPDELAYSAACLLFGSISNAAEKISMLLACDGLICVYSTGDLMLWQALINRLSPTMKYGIKQSCDGLIHAGPQLKSTTANYSSLLTH